MSNNINSIGKGIPCGSIEVIDRILIHEIRAAGALFAFEKDVLIIETVKADGMIFVRIITYSCFAENNSGPQHRLTEDYYEADKVDLNSITYENHKKKIHGAPVYSHTDYDYGVIY